MSYQEGRVYGQAIAEQIVSKPLSFLEGFVYGLREQLRRRRLWTEVWRRVTGQEFSHNEDVAQAP